MHAYMVKLHGKFRILGIYLLLEYWDGEDRIQKTATETKVLGLKFQKTEQRTSNFHKNRISDSSKLNNFVSFSEKPVFLFLSFESKLTGIPLFRGMSGAGGIPLKSGFFGGIPVKNE